jgi:NADH:ubiquinone reductase (H+-translocating)
VDQPVRVLVLGGGYTSFAAVRKLRRAARRREIDVTVVTRDNFLVAHGLIAEMVTGRITPGAIANPARRIFPDASVHLGTIESIDLERRVVVTSRSLDGVRTELEYDQAVLAFGTAEDVEAYPGLAEHAFRLKQLDDCLRLRNHLLTMFELADIERDPEERARLLTFVIAGGGFSGTELAGELADFARVLTDNDFTGIGRDECRVLLVHSGPTILPELYGASNLERPVKSFPRLVEFAMRHAQKLGVELRLNARVTAATPAEVRLSTGETIATRTLISAVGTRPNPLLEALPLERDDRGRVLVDEFLRVRGRSELWSGGDCASVPHPRGGTCSPVALYSIAHGRHIGANISRSVRGRRLRPYRRDVKMQGVSIGRRTAVAELGGIGLRGTLPWLGWRAVVTRVVPSWDRRVRLVADWMIWPFVGRDITQLGSSLRDDYEIEHYAFQVGEAMYERRRPTRYVHVIIEGSAEVVAGGSRIAVLGPSDHFGAAVLDERGAEAVRALSPVRTIALHVDQAERLQRILDSAGSLGGSA